MEFPSPCLCHRVFVYIDASFDRLDELHSQNESLDEIATPGQLAISYKWCQDSFVPSQDIPSVGHELSNVLLASSESDVDL